MSDFLGYAFSNDPIYTSIAALQAVNTTNMQDGSLAAIVGGGSSGQGLYKLSLQAKTGNILPTTGPGWWVLVSNSYLLGDSSAGGLTLTGSFLQASGTLVASATNMTLPSTGNLFFITGTTQIQTISAANWSSGSIVTLQFAGTVVVTHQGSGTGAQVNCIGHTNITSATNQIITLLYNGNSWWQTTNATY
jgi:hypothetical protein